MTFPGERFSEQRLLEVIGSYPRFSGLLVGFSGGADSTALLLALHRSRERLGAPLRAIHFHHGLHPEADSWSRHCNRFCRDRDIPIRTDELNIGSITDTNIEETARDARYRLIERCLGPDEIYLTAHHADDQAETVFLNLMRGSGAEGLAGIPELRSLGSGWVARPLLSWHRSALVEYLDEHRVEWKEDHSNLDPAFDRNFLRQQVFPLMESRWPGLSRRINRSARIARITAEALADFLNVTEGGLLASAHTLSLDRFLQLELAMQTLVIRQWLRQQEIPPPPESRLLEFLDQLAASSGHSTAELRWRCHVIKRYRQEIWLYESSAAWELADAEWSNTGELRLGPLTGSVELAGHSGAPPPGLKVGPRRNHLRIRLHPAASRQSLKEFFRLSGIPPWFRDAIPVLYRDDEPLAVGDWALATTFREWLEANRVEYRWRPASPLLQAIRLQSRRDLTCQTA